MLAGVQGEFPGSLARHPSVDADLARHRQHDPEPPGQRNQPQLQSPATFARDLHRHPQHFVPGALGHQRVPSWPEQVTRAEPYARPTAFEHHAVGLWLDVDQHRRAGEYQRGHGSEDGEAERERRTAPASATHSGRRRRWHPTERDRLDGRAFVRTGTDDAARRVSHRRRSHVVGAPRDDFEQTAPVVDPILETPCTDVQYVATAQPRRRSNAGAVQQHGRGIVARLQEQLILLQPHPGERPLRDACNHEIGACATDRQRQVARREGPVAERFTQQELHAQICSSQRITRAALSRPGRTVSSRRTSRNPVRVPTTV